MFLILHCSKGHLHVVSVVEVDEGHDENVPQKDEHTSKSRDHGLPTPATKKSDEESHLAKIKIIVLSLNLLLSRSFFQTTSIDYQ